MSLSPRDSGEVDEPAVLEGVDAAQEQELWSATPTDPRQGRTFLGESLNLRDLIRANQLMMRVMHGYLHAQLEIPDKKGFSRRQPQCHPAHGNSSHGLPVDPKFSKGAAPRRKALRAARARVDDRHRVEKVGSNPQSLPKFRFFTKKYLAFFSIQ